MKRKISIRTKVETTNTILENELLFRFNNDLDIIFFFAEINAVISYHSVQVVHEMQNGRHHDCRTDHAQVSSLCEIFRSKEHKLLKILAVVVTMNSQKQNSIFED